LESGSEYLSWEKVYERPNNVGGTIESLEAFNGALYAGIGFDCPNGILLLNTDDGESWTEFYSNPGYGLLGHVHALKAFKGYLYLGYYHGHGFRRTDGSETSGEVLADAYPGASGDPFRLLEHTDRFYERTMASLFSVSQG